jgi:hypothetical protein
MYKVFTKFFTKWNGVFKNSDATRNVGQPLQALHSPYYKLPSLPIIERDIARIRNDTFAIPAALKFYDNKNSWRYAQPKQLFRAA